MSVWADRTDHQAASKKAQEGDNEVASGAGCEFAL